MMADKSFSELFSDYIKANLEKCPELLLPRLRHIQADPPFPGGTHFLTYDRLDLKAFLTYWYPDKALQTVAYTSKSIQADLEKKYADFWFYNTAYFFETNGALTEVPLVNLQYYQDEIDLRGRHPSNGSLDDPIWVVQYGQDTYLLYNGYHRACYHILIGKEQIKAYVLKV